MLVTRFYTRPTEESVQKNAYENWQEARSVSHYYNNFNSLLEETRAYPDIKYRYYFMEARHTCPGSQLNFNNDTTWCLQE